MGETARSQKMGAKIAVLLLWAGQPTDRPNQPHGQPLSDKVKVNIFGVFTRIRNFFVAVVGEVLCAIRTSYSPIIVVATTIYGFDARGDSVIVVWWCRWWCENMRMLIWRSHFYSRWLLRLSNHESEIFYYCISYL